jgi:hypothetical protein
MTVGRKLSQLGPEERRGEHALKNAVHDAATAIAREYINEIHPYLGGIDLYGLFRLIDRNVLTRAECEAIFLEYAIAMGTPHEPPHVFSALFLAGLLGWVDVDLVTGRTVQKFLLPGERAFEHGDALPESSRYLLHPVLTSLIGEANPRYVRNRDHVNEIGSGRPWIDQGGDELLCAVRADILHFSAFLGDAARESQVRRALRQALDERRSGSVFVTDEGDAFTLVHRDPREVLSVVKGIQVDLYEATGEVELRVAIDYGPIGLERDAAGTAVGIRRGHDVLWNVARIEPLVDPSQVWVTERFKDVLERTPCFYRAEPIDRDVRAEVRSSDGSFNVKKPGSREEDHFLRLFRIVEPRR